MTRAPKRIIADCGNVPSGKDDLCRWEHWGDLTEYTRTDLVAPRWQPIATAPKNTSILVCQSINGIICSARGQDKRGNWRTGIGPMDYIAAVTHWMPLPAPPEAG